MNSLDVAASATDPTRVTLSAPSRAAQGIRLIPAGESLWRVIDRGERIIGHVALVATDLGHRFRAQRYHAPSRAFRSIGEFWSIDDAALCIVDSR